MIRTVELKNSGKFRIRYGDFERSCSFEGQSFRNVACPVNDPCEGTENVAFALELALPVHAELPQFGVLGGRYEFTPCDELLITIGIGSNSGSDTSWSLWAGRRGSLEVGMTEEHAMAVESVFSSWGERTPPIRPGYRTFDCALQATPGSSRFSFMTLAGLSGSMCFGELWNAPAEELEQAVYDELAIVTKELSARDS